MKKKFPENYHKPKKYIVDWRAYVLDIVWPQLLWMGLDWAECKLIVTLFAVITDEKELEWTYNR